MYTNTDYNVHGAFLLLYRLPLPIPLTPLSNPLSLTWNPPCCDRIRPPRSQVACKLTSPFSTLSPTLPPPYSQNPGYQCLTKTTLRIRHLRSGTVMSYSESVYSYTMFWFTNLIYEGFHFRKRCGASCMKESGTFHLFNELSMEPEQSNLSSG